MGHGAWDRVAIDILDMSVMTPKDNRYVLVIVDCFSRWTEACPLPNKTAPYHPASDRLVERLNITLLMMLAMFAGENRDEWDELLPAVMMAYRSSVNESTGFSPYRLMFGKECTLPMDVDLPRRDQDMSDPIKNPYALWVRDALEVVYDQVRRHSGQAIQRQKRLYDKRAVQCLFAVGDWTLRHYPPSKKCKLDSPWIGPYLVVSLAGWAIGVQLHPDSQIILVHCQDLKKTPHPSGLVSWIDAALPGFWVPVRWAVPHEIPHLHRLYPLLTGRCCLGAGLLIPASRRRGPCYIARRVRLSTSLQVTVMILLRSFLGRCSW